MSRFFFLLCFVAALFWGYKMSAPSSSHHPAPAAVDFPLSEYKSFAIVVYGYNHADWCEKALRSIFEQEYDHFRVVFIDDASCDSTWDKAQAFIADQHQQHRTLFIRNPAHLGKPASLYCAIDSLLDKEIVIPLEAKDGFSHRNALSEMNRAYQNPDVWLAYSSSMVYPTYEMKGSSHPEAPASFYAALFKQIKLSDLMACQAALASLAGPYAGRIEDPSFLINAASLSKSEARQEALIHTYSPLAQFPKTAPPKTQADVLIFSCDRPLQLYACLESIGRYMSGFETLSVLYRASDERFAAGYKKLYALFPHVRFIRQSSEYKKDFKPLTMKAAFDSPSQYILFGVDDVIVKDFTDLTQCMNKMETTGAYGFYLRFGQHISYCYQSGREQPVPLSLPLKEGVYAWSFDRAADDWGFPNSLDMTLYRKSDLQEAFKKLKFKTPNSLEFLWAKEFRPKGEVGLYFESSKIVNIPFNVVGRTGNPHMNYLSAKELLAKFEEGFKMDIAPLHKIANPSPHFEYLPDFILR